MKEGRDRENKSRPRTRQNKTTANHISKSPSPLLPFSPSSVRFLFFGGKGGVGKTTSASAAALDLLDRAREGEQILLLSTDPAHSLTDSLDTRIGDAETVVSRSGKARLVAREMDAAAALERFKARYLKTLAEIGDRGTILDEGDINELLGLSLPGLDEVMALFELSEIDATGRYSRVVIDTAPSGHTWRLLAMPELFAGWVSALDRLQEKHRFMVARLARGRRGREDEVEIFIEEMRERVGRVRRMISDPSLSSFTLVTIPEAMAVEETARYFEQLMSAGVPVTDLIINRVERPHTGCLYCRARAAFQKPWLKRLARDFSRLRIHEVPLFASEVRGPDRLRKFARIAWPGDGEAATRRLSRIVSDDTTTGETPMSPDLSHALIAASPRPRLAASLTDQPNLLIFGGKGGVGKTTAAAAAAFEVAEGNKKKRVLVFSTDPAHSLSDSFDERVGEYKRGVCGLANLDAMEINPARWLDSLKQNYRERVDELFESLSTGSRWQIQFDREAMREMIELTPPGLDEIAALSRVGGLAEEKRYDLIVLDTAPTGHLVRFLELPEVALSWTRAFMKLLLKYKDVIRWEGLAEELVALSKSIKRVISLLTGDNCEFVAVAIAERMSFEETTRLARSLERLGVPLGRVLINNIVPAEAASKCDFCAARLAAQQDAIKLFEREFNRGVSLMVAPARRREVRGRESLREHFADWRLIAGTNEGTKAKRQDRGD
jgi:arsenite-transporting ATPase